MICLSFLLSSLVGIAAATSNASYTFSFPSPRQVLNGTVSLESGKLYYQVSYQKKQVIQRSSLGLLRSDGDLSQNLTSCVCTQGHDKIERYEMLQGKKRFVDRTYSRATCTIGTRAGLFFNVELVSSDLAFAFRYAFPEDEYLGTRIIFYENTTIAIAKSANDYQLLQQYDSPIPKYQAFYQPRNNRTLQPIGAAQYSTGYGLPGLFKTSVDGTDIFVLLKEAGFDGKYPASHISNSSSNGVIRLAFPDPADGNGMMGPPEPTSILPWLTPWRIITIGTSPEAIVQDTSVTDLSDPSKIGDRSWITPGVSSWSWWSNSTNAQNYTQTKAFVDLSEELGWPFSLLDARWDQQTDASGKTVNFQTLLDYAASKSTKLWLWIGSAGVNNDGTAVAKSPKDLMWQPAIRKASMARMAAGGIVGLKVDGIQSDKQQMMSYLLDILKDAADAKLMVVFHNCPVPHGWERTWPNLLSSEALVASEFYADPTVANGDQMPENNVNQAFVRHTTGPSDYSAGTFSHDLYPRDNIWTTYSHELALNVIIDSGLRILPDTPTAYMRTIPRTITRLLGDLPFSWAETRFLAGEPGKYFAIAKSDGTDIYIAAINGETTFISTSTNNSSPDYQRPIGVVRSLTLDLSQLGVEQGSLLIVSDVHNFQNATVQNITVSNSRNLSIHMEPFGGFFAKITQSH